ncbi:MAG TPA: prolipoprotein diacylglyceryl transferase family protein [Rubricoccaceae bacterium]|nr:prolipoprotein diacylglyceryl transferase family protein [Rubricoccaceae bacterium]
MYPRLTDLFRDLFGIDLPLPLYSFGLMVAIAIVTATALTKREFDRMHRAGQLPAVTAKERDEKGRTRVVKASPSALVWTLMLMAAGFGIAGSKLFHVIDYWEEFVRNPLGMLLSPAGLTFYGGLICAGVAIAWYVRRKGLSVPRVADAAAPGLMLAYGIGRLGCYLSGDGDWGTCSSLDDKPAWIPGFLWSETFPRNILGVDPVAFNAAERGEVCTLPNPTGVYPTMLYEFILCGLLFGALWLVRKHPFRAGWLFSLYLVLNGLERFTIEMIRVNPVAAFGLSQAQLIALGLVAAGLVGLALTSRRAVPPAEAGAVSAPAPAAA